MTNYKVMVEEAARLDIISIADHIANKFQEPVVAKRIVSGIMREIQSLRQFPKRAHRLQDEPYFSKGYRVTYVKNYAVFYKVDDKAQTVNVMRALYNRRDWQNLL